MIMQSVFEGDDHEDDPDVRMKLIPGAEKMNSSGSESHEMNSLGDDGISSEISLSSAARLSTLHEGDKSEQEREDDVDELLRSSSDENDETAFDELEKLEDGLLSAKENSLPDDGISSEMSLSPNDPRSTLHEGDKSEQEREDDVGELIRSSSAQNDITARNELEKFEDSHLSANEKSLNDREMSSDIPLSPAFQDFSSLEGDKSEQEKEADVDELMRNWSAKNDGSASNKCEMSEKSNLSANQNSLNDNEISSDLSLSSALHDLTFSEEDQIGEEEVMTNCCGQLDENAADEFDRFGAIGSLPVNVIPSQNPNSTEENVVADEDVGYLTSESDWS
jgi:hypothetical protein